MHKADLRHSNETLQRKLEKVYKLRCTRSVVNWDTEKYYELLHHFGDPHKRVPPVIHVAGTNGKGSIVAMLRAIFEASGLRVHSYTSPHLIEVNERIVLAGEQISDEKLSALIDEALDFVGDAPLSFFEVITAVAFKAFEEVPADVLLLEVGMGGRLDCTNVIEKPLVSIIGRVSMDHMMFLGNTIEEIAAQKAGIMKEGVPCVVGYQGKGDQGKAVLDVMRRTAEATGNPLFIAGEDFSVKRDSNDHRAMIFSSRQSDAAEVTANTYPVPVLPGEHQLANAAAVLMALSLIKQKKFNVSKEAVMQGLQSCQWPGRLQQVDARWPDNVGMNEIWIDCGHNDSAGEVLAEQLSSWQKQDNRPVYLIVGMLGTKDSKSFLKPLLPHLEQVCVVPIPSDPTSQSQQQIEKACDGIVPVTGQKHFEEAVQNILATTQVPVRILIAGSVYLAGAVLQFLKHDESR